MDQHIKAGTDAATAIAAVSSPLWVPLIVAGMQGATVLATLVLVLLRIWISYDEHQARKRARAAE